MIHSLRCGFLLLLFCVAEAELSSLDIPAPDLAVGDPAPSIASAIWLKGVPVREFKKGKVYVIDLWATWCVNCISAMPHLSELAEQYGNDVVVTGMNVNEEYLSDDPEALKRVDAEEVEQRVREFVEDNEDIMRFAVAMEDPTTLHVYRDWLLASGNRGIPTTFIVDREGRLAWIGHPTVANEKPAFRMNLDQALSKVLAGTLDVADAKAQQHARAVRTGLNDAIKSVLTDYRALETESFESKADEAAAYQHIVNVIDTLYAAYPESAMESRGNFRTKFLSLFHIDDSVAIDFLNRAYEKPVFLEAANTPERPGNREQQYWLYVGITIAGADELSSNAYRFAAEKMQQIPAEFFYSFRAWRSLAKLYYLSGDLRAAVDTQRTAIKVIRESGEPETFLAREQTTLALYEEKLASVQ